MLPKRPLAVETCNTYTPSSGASVFSESACSEHSFPSYCFFLRIETTCLQRPLLFAPRGGRFGQVFLYSHKLRDVFHSGPCIIIIRFWSFLPFLFFLSMSLRAPESYAWSISMIVGVSQAKSKLCSYQITDAHCTVWLFHVNLHEDYMYWHCCNFSLDTATFTTLDKKKHPPRDSGREEHCSILWYHAWSQAISAGQSQPRISVTFALRWSRVIELDITW